LDEAKGWVDSGAKEITLLGQNVNAWSGEDDKGQMQGLDGLIRALDRIEGVRRIRYMTSHPNDMTDGLIAAHGDVEKLMPFLHLPVQAGSDRILKAMNRSHSRDSYLRILDRVRTVRPDVALSGDFIVGFPGESDADFEDTMSLVRAVGYAQAFPFKFSPRPGTPDGDPNMWPSLIKSLPVVASAPATTASAAPVPPPELAEAQLRAINHRFVGSFVERDRAFTAGLVHADFVRTAGDGSWQDRAAFLAESRLGECPRLGDCSTERCEPDSS